MNRREFLAMLGAATAASILPTLTISGPASIQGGALWGDWVLWPDAVGPTRGTNHSLACLDREIAGVEGATCDEGCSHDIFHAYVAQMDSDGKRVIYACCEKHREELIAFNGKQRRIFDMEADPYEWAVEEALRQNPGELVEALCVVDASTLAIMGDNA